MLRYGGGPDAKTSTHSQHSSLSQPCLPVSNVGPTRILPYLFLGSQLDSMSRETMLVRVGGRNAATFRPHRRRPRTVLAYAMGVRIGANGVS